MYNCPNVISLAGWRLCYMFNILSKLPNLTNKIVGKNLITVLKFAYFFKFEIKNQKNVKINY